MSQEHLITRPGRAAVFPLAPRTGAIRWPRSRDRSRPRRWLPLTTGTTGNRRGGADRDRPHARRPCAVDDDPRRRNAAARSPAGRRSSSSTSTLNQPRHRHLPPLRPLRCAHTRTTMTRADSTASQPTRWKSDRQPSHQRVSGAGPHPPLTIAVRRHPERGRADVRRQHLIERITPWSYAIAVPGRTMLRRTNRSNRPTPSSTTRSSVE